MMSVSLIRLKLEAEAGEEEVVAGRQGRGEAFLDPAELAAVPEAHVHHRLLDDDAGVHAVLERRRAGRVIRQRPGPSGTSRRNLS